MGLDDELLASPESVPDILRCPICLDVIKDAVCGPCQHTFCRACIQLALRDRSWCPTCKQPMQEGGLHPSLYINQSLDALQVKCSSGCAWVGRQDALSSHLSTCPAVQLAERDEELRIKETRISSLEGELAAMQELLKSKESENKVALEKRDAALADRDDARRVRDTALMALARRDKAAEEQGTALVDQDTALADQVTASPKRDAALDKTDMALTKRDTRRVTIQPLAENIVERDAAVTNRAAALPEKEATCLRTCLRASNRAGRRLTPRVNAAPRSTAERQSTRDGYDEVRWQSTLRSPRLS